MRCALLVTAFLLSAPALQAEDANDLLRAVSDKYEALTSYEFDGVQITTLSGTGCTLEIGIKGAAALPEFPPGIQFQGRKLSNICLDAVTKLGFISTPGQWSYFSVIAVGVVSVSELPQQILRLPGQEIRCAVLEVLYDDYHRRLRSYDGPVRYWVDMDTALVRRVQFTETTGQGVRAWTATLDRIRIGGPPPSWLVNVSTPWKPQSLIGKVAPDLELRTTDNTVIHLRELRNRVVLLDFWDTSCGACEEEIPTFEKLQSEASFGVAVFGVTQETASEVRKWLSEYNRSFLTFVDAKKAFDEFKVGPIPVLVMIDRRGAVVGYELGFRSEQAIREFVRKQRPD